ncbi:Ltp family lipoprotein [Corynebacterium sputi]|uniref:Ltp family lipoprotein n=1 Tax=Corynebacterium sputi TaxID=489915 RepID=UPI000408B632|nr:Ltp family lipoprotein [Corynebacterium sputi]
MTDPQNPQYPGNPYDPNNPQFASMPPQPGPEPKQKKPVYKRGWFIAVAVVFGLVVVGTAIGGGEESSTTASADADTAVIEEAAIEEPVEATQAVEREEAPEPTSETESVPVEYRNALRSAETYVNMLNMSEQGVYDQLTSSVEGFSPEAAQYAIDNIDADYNKAALESAKIYQDMMAMSTPAIYDQLVSQYGEKFTPEQAQYAVDNLPQ